MKYLPEIVKVYEDALKHFCVYNAEIMRMAEKIENGESVDKQKLVFAGLQMADYKESLLKCKEIIGFTDGLLFMEEDSYFSGFSIENGRLKGSKSDVYEGTEKWAVCDLNDPEFSNFKYEVAIFARTLSDPSYMTEEEIYKELFDIRQQDEAV